MIGNYLSSSSLSDVTHHLSGISHVTAPQYQQHVHVVEGLMMRALLKTYGRLKTLGQTPCSYCSFNLHCRCTRHNGTQHSYYLLVLIQMRCAPCCCTHTIQRGVDASHAASDRSRTGLVVKRRCSFVRHRNLLYALQPVSGRRRQVVNYKVAAQAVQQVAGRHQ